MSKKCKVEKETRKIMEGVAELVKKKKGSDSYKFRCGKKKARQVKQRCVHWIIRKGKEQPTVVQSKTHPGYWECTICHAIFPVQPVGVKERDMGLSVYNEAAEQLLQFVNQMQFWSVKLGGDADDTRMFLRMKQDIPRFKKVSKHILKAINKRDQYEKNREKSSAMDQLGAYSGFNYRSV